MKYYPLPEWETNPSKVVGETLMALGESSEWILNLDFSKLNVSLITKALVVF